MGLSLSPSCGEWVSPKAFPTVEVGDNFCFGGIVIGISEIQPLKKVMEFVQAPREIAILRAELVGRTPKSPNPVLRRAISSIPGIH